MTARGVRNNNPGNIDRNDTKWQGMAANQASDERFVVFIAPEYGIRALAMTLLAYEHKHGLNTIRGMINRWAPPVENNTTAYVHVVADKVGVLPDDVIDPDQVAIMRPMVEAIIFQECKGYVYPDTVIDKALHMAGIADAKPLPPKPLVKQASFVTKAVGGATVVCGTAGQYAPVVKGWATQLADYTSIPVIAHVVEIFTFVGGACVIASIVASILKQQQAKKV